MLTFDCITAAIGRNSVVKAHACHPKQAEALKSHWSQSTLREVLTSPGSIQAVCMVDRTQRHPEAYGIGTLAEFGRSDACHGLWSWRRRISTIQLDTQGIELSIHDPLMNGGASTMKMLY